jgi:hypothetical protein
VSSRQPPELAPLRFPVLTFEEAALSPALGYVFDPRWVEPCESIVSLLWKFARANGVPGHLVAANLAPRIDPYEGVEPVSGQLDIQRLRRIVPIAPKALRTSLFPAELMPAASKTFRYCSVCLRSGYHSVLFQLTRITYCPAHQRPLQSACRHCHYTQPLRLNARLLDRPFRCAQCGAPYASCVPHASFPHRLKKQDWLKISRSYFVYWFR